MRRLVRSFVEATPAVVRVGIISDSEPNVDAARILIEGLDTGPLVCQRQTASDEWLFTFERVT